MLEKGWSEERETETELDLENFILQGLYFRFSQEPVLQLETKREREPTRQTKK